MDPPHDMGNRDLGPALLSASPPGASASHARVCLSPLPQMGWVHGAYFSQKNFGEPSAWILHFLDFTPKDLLDQITMMFAKLFNGIFRWISLVYDIDGLFSDQFGP